MTCTRRCVALAVAAALLTSGCGSGRLSSSEFRQKADRICGGMKRKSNSINTLSSRGFAKGMTIVESGLVRLRQLRPPASAASTYADFLAKITLALALVRRDEPELVKLEHELTTALPKRISIYSPNPFRNRRYQALLRRENQLVRRVLVPARRAAKDARRLGLNECAKGLAT